jgi:hypothetical protein
MTAAPQRTEDPGKIIQLLGRSEIVRAAIAETAAANTLARRALIGQVKAIDREHEKRVPKIEAAVVAALAAVKAVEAALLAAQKTVSAALGAKSTASYTYAAQRDRLEQQLRQTAHPAIEPFQRKLRGELDATRKKFAYIDQRETNPLTRLVRHITINNAKSVAARVAAIMAAIDEAERLALELDDQTSIPERLGKLASSRQ